MDARLIDFVVRQVENHSRSSSRMIAIAYSRLTRANGVWSSQSRVTGIRCERFQDLPSSRICSVQSRYVRDAAALILGMALNDWDAAAPLLLQEGVFPCVFSPVCCWS